MTGPSEQPDLLAQLGLDTVEGALAYGGGQDLAKPGLGSRRRTRIELPIRGRGPADAIYLKRYGPEPLGALLRRLGRTGRWESLAQEEAAAISAVARAGVPTMRVLAAGTQRSGWRPGASYLVVSSVPGDALERCGQALLSDPTAPADRPANLTAALAELVARLHLAGWVHRDLYASHVFASAVPGGDVRLHLIDLARAFRPRLRLRRWRVKDLAQLKYSMPADWVQTWWSTFLDGYLSIGPAMRRSGLEVQIDRKVAEMAGRSQRRARKNPAGGAS